MSTLRERSLALSGKDFVSSSSINVLSTASIARTTPTGLKIYPNPASDYIHIELNIPDEISIYSIQGQKMHPYAFNAGQHRIETQIVPGGVYFILSKEGSAKLSIKK